MVRLLLYVYLEYWQCRKIPHQHHPLPMGRGQGEGDKMRIVAGSKGFILIEVIIVSVIISIFAAVAYPSYMRFIKDGQAEQAKAVMNAMATAERITQQNTDKFVTMGDGTWVSINTDDGLYSIGANKIDTGDAPLFQFNIDFRPMDAAADDTTSFRITAKGLKPSGSSGVTVDDTVVYSYRTTANPRNSWTGSMLACTNC